MLDGKTRAVYKDQFLKLIFINRNIYKFFFDENRPACRPRSAGGDGEESESENADGSTRYH